ncbi:MAG: hypothetical protein JSS82_03465 [Bacteroidetes bacterium]|nr:hypothetical protein [Bacteroidota bacterium]
MSVTGGYITSITEFMYSNYLLTQDFNNDGYLSEDGNVPLGSTFFGIDLVEAPLK